MRSLPKAELKSLWNEIWHEYLGWVDDGYYLIKFDLPFFVYTSFSFFWYFSLSIDSILFLYNHWDLENLWADCDEIWHEHLGRWVLVFT